MSQRAFLDRAAILAARDLDIEEVDIPEWGGKVRVRGLTASQRDQFESKSVETKGKKTSVNLLNIRARLVSLCVVDEQGNPLFSESDIHVVGEKSASAIDRIWEVATRLSGIGERDVEELAGNSESDQSEDSSSG
jgi:hypothetical protein